MEFLNIALFKTRVFGGIIKLRILRWRDYLGLSGWTLTAMTNVITKKRTEIGRMQLQTQSEFSRDTKLIGCVYTQKELYFKELAHVIIEARWVQNLMREVGRPESGQCRRLSPEALRLENQGETIVQTKPEGRISFCSSEILFGPQLVWMRTTHIMENNLLYSKPILPFKCKSHPKLPHWNIQNNVWQNLDTVGRSSWHIKLSITPRIIDSHQKLKDTRSRFSPRVLGWSMALLDFGFLTFRIVKGYIYFVLNNQICGNLFWQPQETSIAVFCIFCLFFSLFYFLCFFLFLSQVYFKNQNQLLLISKSVI